MTHRNGIWLFGVLSVIASAVIGGIIGEYERHVGDLTKENRALKQRLDWWEDCDNRLPAQPEPAIEVRK